MSLKLIVVKVPEDTDLNLFPIGAIVIIEDGTNSVQGQVLSAMPILEQEPVVPTHAHGYSGTTQPPV